MPARSVQVRPSILTTPQSLGEIILFEEKTSSFDEGMMPLYHDTLALRVIFSSGAADSLEMIHAVVEKNRQRDRERIGALEREVAELRDAVGLGRPMSRKVSDQRAKKEIVTYFSKHRGGSFDPDEIAQALNLDLSQTVKLCRELASEGEIVEAS